MLKDTELTLLHSSRSSHFIFFPTLTAVFPESINYAIYLVSFVSDCLRLSTGVYIREHTITKNEC